MKKMTLITAGLLVISIAGCNIMQASFLSSTKTKIVLFGVGVATAYAGYQAYKLNQELKRTPDTMGRTQIDLQQAQAHAKAKLSLQVIKEEIKKSRNNLLARWQGNYNQQPLQAFELDANTLDVLTQSAMGKDIIQSIYIDWSDAVTANPSPIYPQNINEKLDILRTVEEKIESCLQ